MTTAPRPKAPLWLLWSHPILFLAGVIAFGEVRRLWGWGEALAEAALLYAALFLLTWLRRRYD